MEMTIDGQYVHYKDQGAGDITVLILQGWGTRCELYDSVANILLPAYRVIQLDFPGFGASEEPEEPWDVTAYANFVERFATELGLTRVILLGHSYGGRVSIMLASRPTLPFELVRLVLMDSAGVLPVRTKKQEAKTRRYKRMRDFLSKPWVYEFFPDLIDDWRSRQGSEDYRNATPLMRRTLVMAVNEDLSGLFDKVSVETLLIWGENDDATPLSDGQKMEAMMQNAGLAVIPEAGHYAFLEQPAVFAGILRAFLMPQETESQGGEA